MPAGIQTFNEFDVSELTDRMTKGDEMAYRSFYDAYADRLSRYLLVVTAGDEHATREALQGTLTRVVRSIKIFSDEKIFWSWLTVLARSALFDESRKRRRYLGFLDRFMRHAKVEEMSRPDDDSGERLDTLLEKTMASLPTEERKLLEWKYLEHRSVREIADELQTTEKTVESRLGRIRRNLKATMLAELKHEPRL